MIAADIRYIGFPYNQLLDQGVRPAHSEMTFLNVPPLYVGSCGDLPQYVGVGKFRCEFCWINDGLPDDVM